MKTVGTGALLSLCIALGAPYGNMAICGSYMAINFSTASAIFLFFILVGLLNLVPVLISRRLGLAQRELVSELNRRTTQPGNEGTRPTQRRFAGTAGVPTGSLSYTHLITQVGNDKTGKKACQKTRSIFVDRGDRRGYLGRVLAHC